MKRICLLLTTLLASQKVCFADTITGESKHPLDSLITCIIDKHEDVVKNLQIQVNWDNPKAVYTLAKQCKSNIENVKKVLKTLNSERTLCPDPAIIKPYVQQKLIRESYENNNNKVTEGAESFENIEFSTKFFVSGDPSIKYPMNSGNAYDLVAGGTYSSVLRNQKQDEIMKSLTPEIMRSVTSEFSQDFGPKVPNPGHVSANDHPKLGQFSKNKLQCTYSFKVKAEGPQKPQPQPKTGSFSFPSNSPTPQPIHDLVGFLILEKPVDYHLFTE